jgi:formate dehydrogenase alpha subunit
VAGLATSLGSGAMTNALGEIENNKGLLVIGSNTTETHPITALKIKKAVKKGAKLVVIDPRRIELTKYADVFLQIRPGTNLAILNGLLHVIIRDGLVDKDFIERRTENFEAVKEAVKDYTPEKVAKICGVNPQDIEKAARIFAEADGAGIYYCMGITQHTTGVDTVFAISNLALATGNVGRENAGVNPLRGQNNVQGACDMGALPVVYPGYQAVANPDVKAKFEQAWGVTLSDKPGLTISGMLHGAMDKTVRAMYIMGENPVLTDPDSNHVIEALNNLDFLVVQDIFMTETAQLADVVLPAATFAEKDGTFTNTERRVQRVRQAITPRGESKPDWMIITKIANSLGANWNYQKPEDIMAEISKVTPSYGGINYERIDKVGLHWPCPTLDHPGTPTLHKDTFPIGKGKFIPVEHRDSQELPDEEYPLILTTGRNLYHYHSGSMTRRAKGLKAYKDQELLEINPITAKELGIEDGETVKVISRRGEITTKVQLTEKVAPKVVFMTFHFAESAVNFLTNPALDPISKTPELKSCAVRIEKL